MCKLVVIIGLILIALLVFYGCTQAPAPAPAPAPVAIDSDGDGWTDSQEKRQELTYAKRIQIVMAIGIQKTQIRLTQISLSL